MFSFTNLNGSINVMLSRFKEFQPKISPTNKLLYEKLNHNFILNNLLGTFLKYVKSFRS